VQAPSWPLAVCLLSLQGLRPCYQLAAAESELTFAAEQDDDDSDADQPEGGSTTEKRVGALHVTLYKAAFASAATVKYAYENGLDLDDGAVIRSAGKHGSLEALAKNYELEGSWDDVLPTGAAARGMCAFAGLHDCHSKCCSPGFTTRCHASLQLLSAATTVLKSSTLLQERRLNFFRCAAQCYQLLQVT
jgi:hypothetical protein